MLDLAEKYLPQHVLDDTIHVADAALITMENLTSRDRHKYRFVFRMSDSFKLAQELIPAAWDQGNWTVVGTLSDKKDAAVYRVQEFQRALDGRVYRLIVVHSDKLEAQKWKTIQRNMEKDRLKIQRVSNQAGKQEYHSLAAAHQAVLDYAEKAESKYWNNKWQVVQEPAKRTGRGRPKKDEEPELVFKLLLVSTPKSESQLRRMAQEEGTFILISNVVGKTATELLQIYKGQPTVEMLCRAAKSEYEITPVFFQREDRIESFTYVFMLALLVYRVMEYHIRQTAQQTGEGLPHTPGKKPDMRPTARKLLEVVGTISTVRIRWEGGLQRQLASLTEKQRIALRLMGTPPSTFTTPRDCKILET